MTKINLILAIFLATTSSWASDKTIIDPDLMNKDIWAEPYFPTPEEAERAMASEPQGKTELVKGANQYLDVVRRIPSSEPSISRAWLEYKILKSE